MHNFPGYRPLCPVLKLARIQVHADVRAVFFGEFLRNRRHILLKVLDLRHVAIVCLGNKRLLVDEDKEKSRPRA